MINLKKVSFLIAMFCGVAIPAFTQTFEEGKKMYLYDKYESAIGILEPLSAESAIANYYLGLSQLYSGKKDIARETFQKKIEHPANLAGMARVLFMEGKKPEGMAMLEKVVDMSTRKNKSPYLYAADAITYSNVGNPNKAIEWYKVYQEYQNTGEVLINMGDAYRFIEGGGGQAMTNFQTAATLEGYQSLANYRQGNLWYSAKNYDSALVCYERASRLDPDNPLPYYDLANAYYKINKFSQAKTQIEEYIKRSDNTPADQIQYANILYLAKDYDKAIQKMQGLISSGHELPYMFRVIGYSQYEKGEYQNALANMDKFFAKQEKDKILPSDYFYYAKILNKIPERKAEANSYFEKGIAIDKNEDKTEVYREIANSFKDENDYLNAAKWFEKVTATGSKKVEYLDYWWAGRCYYQVDSNLKALPMFQKVIELDADGRIAPSYYSGQYWTAVVQAALDSNYDQGTALANFDTYLNLVEGQEDKTDEIVTAYVYKAVVAYNQKDMNKAKEFSQKIIALKPDNHTANQLLQNIK